MPATWSESEHAALVASHERERKSALETQATLVLDAIMALLPARDLTALASTSWTLYNRCAFNERVWRELFEAYVTSLPFILLYSSSLPTFRLRLLRARKCLSLHEALACAVDGDVLRLPCGRFDISRASDLLVSRNVVIQGTRVAARPGDASLHVVHDSSGAPVLADEWLRLAPVRNDDWRSPHSPRLWSESTPPLRNFAAAESPLVEHDPVPAAAPASTTAPVSAASGSIDAGALAAFADQRLRCFPRVAVDELLAPLQRFVTRTRERVADLSARDASAVTAELKRLALWTQRALDRLQPQATTAPRNNARDMVHLNRSIKRLNEEVSVLEAALLSHVRLAPLHFRNQTRRVGLRDTTSVLQMQVPAGCGPTLLLTDVVGSMGVSAARFTMLDVFFSCSGNVVGVSCDGAELVRLHNCWLTSTGGTLLRVDGTERDGTRLHMSDCALSGARHGLLLFGSKAAATLVRTIVARCTSRRRRRPRRPPGAAQLHL